MSRVDIVAMATQLAAADPASADRTGLGRLVSLVQQSRAWLDALDVRIGIVADRLAHEGRSEPAAELLSDDGRRSSRDARAAGRRAGLCATIPAAHDALAAGHVTAGHVDALADASSKLSASEQSELRDRAPELVASARDRSIRDFQRDLDDTVREIQADDGTSRLERQRAARNVARRVDRVTGMCRTSLELDPVTDAAVWTAINAQIKSRQAASGATDHWQHTAVDAIVDLVTGAQAVSTRVPDVIVHIDVDTLVDGPHRRTLCGLDDGQPIPVTTVRRLACDANLIPVVLDGDGVVLDLGRGRRHWPAPNNALRYGPCTPAAASLAATSRSIAARSTTSKSGSATSARPTSTV